jgi:uncharacterized membrane protein
MSDAEWTLVLAPGAGFVTGLRSMTLPAFLSRRLSSESDKGTITRQLTRPGSATLLSALAAGEKMADKTPFISDRTDALSLVGRAAIAGLCGVAIAEYRDAPPLPAALISSLAAVGSTFLSYTIRKNTGTLSGLPDSLLGTVEDALVLLSASRLVEALDA